VVVFHFSGHGSQVWDTQQIFPSGRVSTLVPFDALLPAGYPYQGGKVNDITGHTLWLLMQAINTENITFVFDSCYSGGARKGNLVVRSRPEDLELIRSDNPNIKICKLLSRGVMLQRWEEKNLTSWACLLRG
jgi:hypothetical protein